MRVARPLRLQEGHKHRVFSICGVTIVLRVGVIGDESNFDPGGLRQRVQCNASNIRQALRQSDAEVGRDRPYYLDLNNWHQHNLGAAA